VVIPNGFSANVKRGDKTRLVVAVDMSNILIGKTVRAAVGRVVATLNVGTELTVQKKLGVSRTQAETRSYPIVVEDNQLFNPATNYAEYLIPVVLYFMLHIYVTVLLAGTFLEEKLSFLERVGQLLTTGVWALILGALTWLYLPWAQVTVASGFWLGQLAFLAYLVAQTAFIVAIFTLYRGSKTGFQTILFLSMLGLMLSGVTWPTYAFPEALARLSELLPFTHLARLIRLTVHYQSQLPDVSGSLKSLGGLTCVFVFAVVILKGVFAVLARLRVGRGSHDTAA
jgi:ABC-2 type transport system permease protein